MLKLTDATRQIAAVKKLRQQNKLLQPLQKIGAYKNMFKKIIASVTPSVAIAALLCNTLLYCGAAQAQEIYPNKPIKIVLGVAPGASTDFLAREVGRGLSERIKVPVVIEYKAGANTIIGTNAVAKSAPDGYTLYLTKITTAINPFVYTNLPFDFNQVRGNPPRSGGG